jgi:predicted Zn-dependent protease
MLSTLGRLDEAQGERKGVPNWLSTHPDPLSRVEEIRPQVQQLKAAAAGAPMTRDRDVLLRRVDGLVYGDSPEQGITRGTTFFHPPLRFRIDFPMGWDVMNSPSQVVAKAPNADVYMLFELVEQPQGRTMQDVASNQLGMAGFRAVQGDRATIDGLEAFIGLYQGQTESLGAVTMRAAHIAYERNVYMVAGLAAPNVFQPADGAFLSAIRSFKRLSPAEAENIRPNRIDLYVVRSGDTWQSIADRSGGVIKPGTLAVMNDADPSSQPQAGARIKIVVGG